HLLEANVDHALLRACDGDRHRADRDEETEHERPPAGSHQKLNRIARRISRPCSTFWGWPRLGPNDCTSCSTVFALSALKIAICPWISLRWNRNVRFALRSSCVHRGSNFVFGGIRLNPGACVCVPAASRIGADTTARVRWPFGNALAGTVQ